MDDLYKIILVDDEDEVRGRISSKILAGSGFVVAGTAGNGYDALELIEKYNPHVVLTDIKMPYIDGIELAHIIRRDYPAIKIGFITGYDEFDYAREAIKLNVFTYLTKPLTQDDISVFLRKLKQDLDTEIAENYNRELIQKRYEESIPLIIENTFISILASGTGGREEDIDHLRHNGISLDETAYILGIVNINRNPENWNIIEFQKLKMSVRSRLSALLEQESYVFYSFIFNDNLVYIIKERGISFKNEIDLVFNRMIKTTDLYLSVTIDIGASLTHKTFNELSTAYEESQLALSFNRYNTVSKISWYNQFGEREILPVIFKDSDARKLEHLLRYADDEEIFLFLDELKKQAFSVSARYVNMSLYIVSLISQLSSYSASAGINFNDLTGVDIIELIEKTKNIDQLFLWVEKIVKVLREKTIASRVNNAQRILDQAVQYINEFYCKENLTMEAVCGELGISESYLSQLFKKYKETTFVKLLTSLRMEKAISMLVTTGDRIVEIANACGYQDVYYFSHSFKNIQDYPLRIIVKNIHHKSRSIGFTIFIMTLGIVSLVLILTSVVFLGIFSKLLDDIIESQAREINKQIVMNYESYINSVIETATYIQTATIKYDTLTDTKSLDELYLANTEIKKDVVSIVLFNTDGKRVAGSHINPQNKESIKGLSWFTSALLIKEIYHFSTEQGKSIAENKEENVISISKSVSYTAGKNTLNGVLLIELNNETLTDLAKKTNLGEAGHLLILNDKGDLIYSSESGNALMTELSTPIARNMFLGSSKATINNINMYISVNTLIQTRWRIVTVSNINEIRNALTRVSGILLLIFLVAVAVSALVAGLISLRVSHPINQLKTAMLNIEQGDFSQPISVSGQIEIVTLTHSFNNMILKIQELMARLVSQQREKRKMELHILQNQINPHFLYNTLDSIVWLAEHERNKDVITTVVSLAHFFRISISKGESFIPIEDEIFHVENYLTIQNIRYVNKFTYTISIDERLNKIKVMKLILQPLVENAIYHGIGDEEGHITIRGIMEKDFIVFHVINTGYGLTNEKIEQMYETMRGGTERPSIGIRNVYQRLKLYYGEKADMTISSIPDESTTISLYIPYKEEIIR